MSRQPNALFRSAFADVLLTPGTSEQFKATLNQERPNLTDWTQAMTRVAVEACRRCGWDAAARGHTASFLPVARSEYLALDVVAFSKNERRWRFPATVIELENSSSDDKVAYAFWKTVCVQSGLRVTVCYRPNREAASALIRHLRNEVVGAMGLAQRVALLGDTCVVIGHRDEGGTFPHGYFSWWCLDTNMGTFQPA